VVLERNIRIDREQIADFCRRNHIRRLALFGSVLRDDFRPDSDVDVLVEFEPGTRVGWEFVSMADEMESILGRNVDFVTRANISHYIKDKVERESEVIYGDE
jgi:uncharacterized protein